MTGPTAGPRSGAESFYYAEDHAALRWPLLAAGIAAPVIAVASAVAAIVLQNMALLVVCLLALAVWIIRGQLLPYVWPAGIRLDENGIRIGGVRWADKHPGRVHPRPTVPRQWSQEFGCSWAAVQRIGVVTDRQTIKTMIRHSYHGRKPTPLGNLATPFIRAALVIWVEQEMATLPAIEPASGLLSANWSSPGYHQPVWITPTRRPQRLRSALKGIPSAAEIGGNPLSDLFAETQLNPEVANWES